MSGLWTYDFESVSDDADSHEFFTIVAPIHHEGVCEAFDYGALGFPESFDRISAGRVGDVDRGADLDIIANV